MVVNRKKKANKFRGSNTHAGAVRKSTVVPARGWSRKRRSRQERPAEDDNKTQPQGIHRKIWIHKAAGSYGHQKTINIDEIEKHIDNFIADGSAKKVKDIVEIDMPKAGYDKVLGRGKITTKMK